MLPVTPCAPMSPVRRRARLQLVLAVLMLLMALKPARAVAPETARDAASEPARTVAPETAPDASLSLDWSAPPNCPSRDAVRADVRGLLSARPGTRHRTAVVRASIRAIQGEGFELVLHAEGGERIITGKSCERLGQAAALLVALLLDPSLDSAAAPDASSAPQPKSVPLPIPSPVPLPAAPQLRGVASSALRLEHHAWPALEPSGVLGLGLERGPWRLLGRLGVGTRQHFELGQGAELALLPTSLGLEPSYALRSRPWGLYGVVTLELGLTFARSRGLSPTKQTELSLQVAPQLRVTRELSERLRLGLAAGPGLPLWRPRWVIEGRAAPIALGTSLRAELGLELLF